MTKLKAIMGLLVVTLGVNACASMPTPSNVTRDKFVKMNQGRVSDVKFGAIKTRCANMGSRQSISHLLGNVNFSFGATGTASLAQGLGNLFTIFTATQKEKGTFDECMAQHGFYPRG